MMRAFCVYSNIPWVVYKRVTFTYYNKNYDSFNEIPRELELVTEFTSFFDYFVVDIFP